MANVYNPQSVGVKPPAGGFKQGGWYGGRQFWGGTLSEPGSIHPLSDQVGAGKAVSTEVNAQSAAAQGVSPQQLESYLQKQRQSSQQVAPSAQYTPTQMNFDPSGGAGAGSMGVPGATAAPALDLNRLYDTEYASSGIKDLEQKLIDYDKRYTEAKDTERNNPWLSQADMTGRLDKIGKKYQDETAGIRNELAMKKADIETKLNLATKQFDINSQTAKQSLDQFNTLLSMGALSNASGEDIAQLTYSTGIPTSMIQSAIQSSQKKDVKTQLITATNDAGVVTATLINSETGDIINTQNLGSIGNKQNGGSGATATKNVADQFVAEAQTLSAQSTNAGSVGVFPQLVAKYAPFMSLEQIYTNYLNTSIGKAYGSPKESATEVKEIYDYYRGTDDF